MQRALYAANTRRQWCRAADSEHAKGRSTGVGGRAWLGDSLLARTGSEPQRGDIFIGTPRPAILASPVGTASTVPCLDMPPRWGLRRCVVDARTVNMPFLRN
jgi:hypothetical protein